MDEQIVRTSTDAMAAKARIRARMRIFRQNVTPEQADQASAAVCNRMLMERLIPDGATVAFYWPLEGELDPRPLADQLVERGYPTCLPIVGAFAAPMNFHVYTGEDDLIQSRLGTWEPSQSAERVEPQVILMPLLAFDARCHRLGFGGGYYDRTLAALADADVLPILIGLAFDEQELDDVPSEEHDWPLHWVVTPTRLIGAGT